MHAVDTMTIDVTAHVFPRNAREKSQGATDIGTKEATQLFYLFYVSRATRYEGASVDDRSNNEVRTLPHHLRLFINTYKASHLNNIVCATLESLLTYTK